MPNNPYPGINAHLNSFLLQKGGGWEAFHRRHVDEIAQQLDRDLSDDYYAVAEKSLQLSEGINIGHRAVPDVLLFQVADRQPAPTGHAVATAPSATLALSDVIEVNEDYLSAVVVYQIQEGQYPGRPITRIELLSPANMPAGSHHQKYMAKRLQTLQAGLALIEIDYLHTHPPILSAIPAYPAENAVPYTILISDPRPTLSEGRLDIYGFGVLDPIPTVPVPLADDDRLPFDLNTVYHDTFGSLKIYRMVLDYAHEPADLAAYRPEDRQRLRQFMAEIQAAPDEA
jgi:hypothetical protein